MVVDCFIPTYNVNETLLEITLESVLSQTFKDITIWLVDDASTDDTPQRLDEWAKRDSRIHVIHKQHDGSVPFAWNEVFPKLKGEFVLYMSHDDLLSPDCIELLVKKQQEGNYDCVIPSCVGFEKDEKNPEVSFTDFNNKSDVSSRGKMSGKEAFFEMLDYRIPGFALWRTEIIRKSGMPTESFNSDECMQRVWASQCKEVAFEGKAKFYYRMVPGSITKGLKPYHYGSLLTNARLIQTAEKLLTTCSTKSCIVQYEKFRKHSRKTYIYLAAQFKKNIQLYSNEEQNAISFIVDRSCDAFFSKLEKFFLPLIVTLYSKKRF